MDTWGGSSSGSLRFTAVNAGCDAVTISARRSWVAALRVNVPITATAMMILRDICPPLVQNQCQNQPLRRIMSTD